MKSKFKPLGDRLAETGRIVQLSSFINHEKKMFYLSCCLSTMRKKCFVFPVPGLRQQGLRRSVARPAAPHEPKTTGHQATANRPRALGTVATCGYLLLEVLLAIAILSLVVVIVFQIIQTALRVTSDLNYLQTQQRKVDGICELLRRNFVSMPQTCFFQTRDHNGSMELLFRNAPFSFAWAKAGAKFGTVVIGSRPQADGRFSLSVLEESGKPLESYVDSGIERKGSWVPLISDVDRLSWRFYDARVDKWSSDWPDTGSKPNLVEITFKLAGRDHLERGVFRWPIAQTGS
jgi:type II secretion system protein J